jgi:hypothetical protein
MVVPLLLWKNTVDGFLRRILDRRVFSKVFNTLRECGTLPSVHVSSERASQQNIEEQENILEMVQNGLTGMKKTLISVSQQRMSCNGNFLGKVSLK